MNMQIVNSFALIGGSGCTLMLLLDTFLFSKNKASKTVAKMAIVPGLFNINGSRSSTVTPSCTTCRS